MIELDLELQVHAMEEDAAGVRLFDLRRADGGELPPFTAGAHIDVAAGADRVRQYSLFNDPRERHRYRIAVALETGGRGGSLYLHRQVRQGDRLPASAPRNHFAMVEDDSHSVLIAGGIGITPLWAMAQQCEARGRTWELHYGARGRATAALLAQIEDFAAKARHGEVRLHFSREGEMRRMDLRQLLLAAPAHAHFYCCGTNQMLQDYQAAACGRPSGNVHLEHFAATQQAATGGGYTVVLARSGRDIAVAPGQTILDALEACGIRAGYTCREGICGDCEVTVLEGEPDHRDDVLTAAERAGNRSMMICCSGCKGSRLVLDL